MSQARLREFMASHDLTPAHVILMAKIIKDNDTIRSLDRQRDEAEHKKLLLWAINVQDDKSIVLDIFDGVLFTAPMLMMLIEDLAGHARRLTE